MIRAFGLGRFFRHRLISQKLPTLRLTRRENVFEMPALDAGSGTVWRGPLIVKDARRGEMRHSISVACQSRHGLHPAFGMVHDGDGEVVAGPAAGDALDMLTHRGRNCYGLGVRLGVRPHRVLRIDGGGRRRRRHGEGVIVLFGLDERLSARLRRRRHRRSARRVGHR